MRADEKKFVTDLLQLYTSDLAYQDRRIFRLGQSLEKETELKEAKYLRHVYKQIIEHLLYLTRGRCHLIEKVAIDRDTGKKYPSHELLM